MKALKTLPLRFRGELHNVHLVNFSVDPDEIKDLLPDPLEVHLWKGRALISMVDVQLRHMRPARTGGFLRFNYRHIGMRLLINDQPFHNSYQQKGIFFLRSFTNKAHVVAGGKLMTNFRLEKAELAPYPKGFLLRKGTQYLRYEVDEGPVFPSESTRQLIERIGAIDRAYAVMGPDVYVTQVLRKHWPLEPVPCCGFRTNFFHSAQLEGVLRVPETIHYTWLAPQKVKQCASPSLVPAESSVA